MYVLYITSHIYITREPPNTLRIIETRGHIPEPRARDGRSIPGASTAATDTEVSQAHRSIVCILEPCSLAIRMAGPFSASFTPALERPLSNGWQGLVGTRKGRQGPMSLAGGYTDQMAAIAHLGVAKIPGPRDAPLTVS